MHLQNEFSKSVLWEVHPFRMKYSLKLEYVAKNMV